MSQKRKNIENIYPLTPMQEGLLFHSILQPEEGLYLEQLQIALEGNLHVESFKNAWETVIRRHQVFRTLFIQQGKSPTLQVVLNDATLPWEIVNLHTLSHEEQSSYITAFLQDDRQRGLNLESAPLMRITLIKLSPNSHYLVWSHHHAILDGWSITLVLKEVFLLYYANKEGADLTLPSPPAYEKYVYWLKQQRLDLAQQFWEKEMAGFETPTTLTIPNVNESFTPQHEPYKEIKLRMCSETLGKLQRLAREHQLTLSTIIQGAWSILLSRYCRSHDLVLGVTVTGRPPMLVGVEEMVGLFINTLPLRVRVHRNSLLIPWLQDLQKRHSESREYGYAPLVRIQEWSHLQAGSALFDTLLVVHNLLGNLDAELSNYELSVTSKLAYERTNYSLNLGVLIGETIELQLGYDTERFLAEIAQQLLNHMQALLTSIATTPERVGDVSMLTPAEQAELINFGNPVKEAYPYDGCIHHLIANQANTNPFVTAISFEQVALTYQALDRRANQLAHYLRQQGVTLNTRVGLYVQRSIETIIGLLAILKAGGTYVPLDPKYPPARLRFMIDDADLSMVLSQQCLQDQLPDVSIPVWLLDKNWKDIAAFPESPPLNVARPDSLAYIMYTSGTTGTPKGVMITHQGLCNVVFASTNTFDITVGSRLLQHASLSFDNSAWEIFMALSSGATLCLGKQETLFDPIELSDYLLRESVTIAVLTPTILGGVPIQSMPALETLLVGGESCPADLANSWRVNRRFFNTYGPTEASIHTSYYECESNVRLSPPIGKANSNIQTYVLDHTLDMMPLQVPGELHIGGLGVAAGYWQQPKLTAEKFVPNPYTDQIGGRLYGTGDLVCYQPTGDLVFLGRVDHQVKINGVRIEPREIELTIKQHPAVDRCVVAPVTDTTNMTTRLVAYYVPLNSSLTESSIRHFLHEKLPFSMIPSLFIQLDDIPLSPTGKTDYNALAVAYSSTTPSSPFHIAAQSTFEKLLSNLWCSVLTLNRVGINDNFFSLGGNSMLAMRLALHITQTFSVTLPLYQIFERPTIKQLAKYIENASRQHELYSSSPVPDQNRDQKFPLSYEQQRLWFLDQGEQSKRSNNITIAVRLSGSLESELLSAALLEVVKRHEALRTRFVLHNGEPTQEIIPADVVSLPFLFEDFSQMPIGERESLIQKRIVQSDQTMFDLSQGTLIHASLIKEAEATHVLILTLHHIISDGWSSNILLHELFAIYRALTQKLHLDLPSSPTEYKELFTIYRTLTQNLQFDLPSLPIHYADYAVWQRKWLAESHLEQQVDYWRNQLVGMPTALELPFSQSRPAHQTFKGANHLFTLPPALSRALKVLSQAEGVTLFMLLLAGFKALLLRYTGQEDLVVGTGITNRAHVNVEHVIGFFVNMLVLRTNVSSKLSFLELLGHVRTVCLDAYTHQDVPFDKLVDVLQVERDLSRNPLFQILFIVEDAIQLPSDEAGLRVESIAFENTHAKFDLAVVIVDNDDSLSAAIEYNTDLFSEQSIVKMAEHFTVLLSGIVSDPAQPIWQLPLLTPDENQQLMPALTSSPQSLSEMWCIHIRFEFWASQSPGATAIVLDGNALTYDALNRRANQLAHYLRQLGVCPEMAVGLLFESSAEMIIAILAVLKAGGVYVPLDPTHPIDRIRFMVEDSDISVLLLQQQLELDLSTLPSEVKCIDVGTRIIASMPDQNWDVGVTIDNAAYIIYTSGSSGMPKGVVCTHRHVARLFTATDVNFCFDNHDVWTLFHSYMFDFSVWEMWGALCYGGKLIIVPYWTKRDPANFLDLLVTEQVTVLNQTPSAFYQLMESCLSQNIDVWLFSLRYIIFGGEALNIESLPRWFEQFGDQTIQLINMYGITETTVHVTYRPIDNRLITQHQRLSIGSPIGTALSDLNVYILDADYNLLPAGIQGEIFVGGEGVARGYYGRPSLTSERFVPNPFGSGRLYQSGDQAMYDANGELIYRGRIDQQVKLRGFRIELGEIEAALINHPAIQQSAVLVQDDLLGNPSIVAYALPRRTESAELMIPAGLMTHTLSNGLTIAHQSQIPLVESMYNEIFDAQSYLKHGIVIEDGACIFDVGANIGLFTLFACQQAHDVQVFAFEPIPILFTALQHNVATYGLNVQRFQYGVGAENGVVSFTFYPEMPMMSGQFANEHADRALSRTIVQDWMEQQFNGLDDVNIVQEADQLLETRFMNQETHQCSIHTLSHVISSQQIKQIDLLKIDVEKSELDVLKGIAEQDWGKIRQIVIEVHSTTILNEILPLLKGYGFSCHFETAEIVNQESRNHEAKLYMLYGKRPSEAVPTSYASKKVGQYWENPKLTSKALRQCLETHLPAYMIPTDIILLSDFPQTSNGKLARNLLPSPAISVEKPDFIEPRNPFEVELAQIWSNVLGGKPISVEDDFFELGGHSLLAVKVVSQIQEKFGVMLPIYVVFQHATVAALSIALIEQLIEQTGANELLEILGDVA